MAPDDAAPSQSPSQAPGPLADLPAICTDRPTKSNVACAVEPGHVQYEIDLFDDTSFRQKGQDTVTALFANPTVKYGLNPGVDVEVSLVPYETVSIRSPSGGATRLTGLGDLYLRLKYNVYNSSDGRLSVAVIPVLKAPTARVGIGDGAVESGVLIPIDYKLTDQITLATVPEVDAFKDLLGDGRHVNTAQLINVGYSPRDDLTLYAELWADWNFDPIQPSHQYSADIAVAWGANKYLQFDSGLNIGLNRSTPGVEFYTGVSKKF